MLVISRHAHFFLHPTMIEIYQHLSSILELLADDLTGRPGCLARKRQSH